MNLKKEFKSGFLLILIFAVSIVITTLFSYGVDVLSDFWEFVLGYFILLIIILVLDSLFKRKFFKIASIIIILPVGFVFVLLLTTLPLMTSFLFAILYFTTCIFIPAIFILINRKFHFIEMPESMYTYITLSFSTCVALLFHKLITKVVYYFLVLNENMKRTVEKYEISHLLSYINEISNIRFLIYISYFIYMVIFSIEVCWHDKNFSLNMHEKAIAQSFITFLAFDRLLVNSNQIRLLPSEIIKFVWSSLNKIFQEDKIKDSDAKSNDLEEKNPA